MFDTMKAVTNGQQTKFNLHRYRWIVGASLLLVYKDTLHACNLLSSKKCLMCKIKNSLQGEIRRHCSHLQYTMPFYPCVLMLSSNLLSRTTEDSEEEEIAYSQTHQVFHRRCLWTRQLRAVTIHVLGDTIVYIFLSEVSSESLQALAPSYC